MLVVVAVCTTTGKSSRAEALAHYCNVPVVVTDDVVTEAPYYYNTPVVVVSSSCCVYYYRYDESC